MDRRGSAQCHRLPCDSKMKIAFASLLLTAALKAQGPLDPGLLKQPPTSAWPTYHGDYSGRHFSPLKQINDANVNGLTLAWVYRLDPSTAGAIVGGEGPEIPAPGSNTGFGGP